MRRIRPTTDGIRLERTRRGIWRVLRARGPHAGRVLGHLQEYDDGSFAAARLTDPWFTRATGRTAAIEHLAGRPGGER